MMGILLGKKNWKFLKPKTFGFSLTILVKIVENISKKTTDHQTIYQERPRSILYFYTRRNMKSQEKS